jgi:hypothetical protein
MNDDPDDIPHPNPIHHAVGEAIEAYSNVESALASLLESILDTDFQKAHILFFAVQSARSRNEMLQRLLELQFQTDIKKYWASCASFISTLADFRNAIVHWHPFYTVYVNQKLGTMKMAPSLGHPVMIGSKFKSLQIGDFDPFLKDCLYIRGELGSLKFLVKEKPSPLPEKFQKPITRRNLAVLRPRQTAKAPQPLRKPSVPKLTKFQKRKKAQKEARERAKKK